MDALCALIPLADLLAFVAAGIVLNLTPGAISRDTRSHAASSRAPPAKTTPAANYCRV